MIGLQPINSAPINGVLSGGELHAMSAQVTAAANGAVAAPVRLRAPRVSGSAAATCTVAQLSAERFLEVGAVASAQLAPLAVERHRDMAAGAVARAFKVKFQPSMEKAMGAVSVVARCFVAPAGMLINAAYHVVAMAAQCVANAGANLHVVRIAKGYFWNPARAMCVHSRLSARRELVIRHRASALANHATGIRNAQAGGQGLARAMAVIPLSFVRKVLTVAASAVARILRHEFAHILAITNLRGYASATARPPAMVTWMYVYEPDYRTVFVRNDASTTRMRTFRKQPAEVLPYDMDFAEWLAPLHGDDIESAQVYVHSAVNGDPADLDIERVLIIIKNPDGVSDVEPVRVKVWLSGGLHGATYKVTVRVDTEGGRRKEVDFRLTVREV